MHPSPPMTSLVCLRSFHPPEDSSSTVRQCLTGGHIFATFSEGIAVNTQGSTLHSATQMKVTSELNHREGLLEQELAKRC